MSNFNIFNTDQLKLLIEPYVEGMTAHIIPIKFEAITPDIFAFFFRSHGSDGSIHYFVSLEFDYIESLESAQDAIEDWYGGKVIEFLNREDDEEGNDIKVDVGGPYQAVLAVVEAPTDNSFWATNVIVKSKDEIDEVVDKLAVENKDAVRKELIRLFSGDPEIEVSVYVAKDGKVEYFFG